MRKQWMRLGETSKSYLAFLVGTYVVTSLLLLTIAPLPKALAVSGLVLGGGIGAIALYFLWWWFSVLVHELGHGVAAVLGGFHLRALAVGRVKVEYSPFRVTLREAKELEKMVGYAWALPSHNRHLRRRLILLYAGGPIASLLLVGVVLPLPLEWIGKALLAFPSLHALCSGFQNLRGSKGDFAVIQHLRTVRGVQDLVHSYARQCPDPAEVDRYFQDQPAWLRLLYRASELEASREEQQLRVALNELADALPADLSTVEPLARVWIAWELIRRARDLERGRALLPAAMPDECKEYWLAANILLALHDQTESKVLPQLQAYLAKGIVPWDWEKWFAYAKRSLERRIAAK